MILSKNEQKATTTKSAVNQANNPASLSQLIYVDPIIYTCVFHCVYPGFVVNLSSK